MLLEIILAALKLIYFHIWFHGKAMCINTYKTDVLYKLNLGTLECVCVCGCGWVGGCV